MFNEENAVEQMVLDMRSDGMISKIVAEEFACHEYGNVISPQLGLTKRGDMRS